MLNPWVWMTLEVKGQGHSPLIRNILKTMRVVYEVGPPEHLYVGPTGIRLAPSDLTSDDLDGPTGVV